MKLPSEFIRLPVSFDAETLAREVSQFSDNDWDQHPQGFSGNTALILVSAGGGRNNDYVGHMQATPHLERCPYMQQVLASFNSVIGRSRLMRLDPGCEVKAHCDIDYSWRHRVRIHIPIITDEAVEFSSTGNRSVNMKPGEAWVFDNWKEHAVYNRGKTRRVHLVIDTTGSAEFWERVNTALESRDIAIPEVPFDKDKQPELLLEQFNSVAVRGPNDVERLLRDFASEATFGEQFDRTTYSRAENRFLNDWRSNWSLHGDTLAGLPKYRERVRTFKATAKPLLGHSTTCTNNVPAVNVLSNWLNALTNEKLIVEQTNTGTATRHSLVAQFDRPVFIVSAPRSGSTMLFELLRQNIEFWTIGDESHTEFESIRSLHPAASRFASNALDASQASDEVVHALTTSFLGNLKNARGTLYSEVPAETRMAQFRFLEKTPKNALRIPFLRAVFPDARFIFLHRSPKQNISSIIEAWQSGRFITYPNLPDWHGLPWSLLLPEGWRTLRGKSVAEIAAFQWSTTNRKIYQDLSVLPDDDWIAVSYENLVSNKHNSMQRLCEFADVPFGPRMQTIAKEVTPLSQYTVTAPDPDKWKRYEKDILPVLPHLADVEDLLKPLD